MCIPTTDCLFFNYIPGSEEDLFYDAPSSPIGEKPFFPDNPMPLRYVDASKRKSLIKEDAQKNMTDFFMTFEISEVQKYFFSLSAQLNIVIKFCKNYFYLTLLSVILVISV